MGVCFHCGEQGINTPVYFRADFAEETIEHWFCSEDCLLNHLKERYGR